MRRIAIVGSGPSAIYTLRNLIDSSQPFDIAIFEAGPLAGVGTPYDPRTTSPEMLANIASIEIPPVRQSFVEFLACCSAATLEGFGIDGDHLDERAFHPRVALGAYFAAQLALLVNDAAERGSRVELLAGHRVLDVAPVQGAVDVTFMRRGCALERRSFDKVVLATGHTAPHPPMGGKAGEVIRHCARDIGSAADIGILGSSLSAIDIAVAVAAERGSFSEEGYTPGPGVAPFSLTMMSRGGRLPEADFYCPLPTEPAPGFTEAEVAVLIKDSSPGQVLDTVFARFAEVLGRLDPAYATRIGLPRLTADTFAAAYFAERDDCDPFVWARLNLDETLVNAWRRHTVPWRYAILRMHEAFAICLAALDDAELRRFDAGLKRVFVDNYAAVPPRSIERLLALHEAGILRLVALADDYEIAAGPVEGSVNIRTNGIVLAFDRLADARGQAAADEDAFPFPTLRLLLKANRDLDDGAIGNAVRVGPDYRLADGANPLRDVYCLSLPFLLDRQPFIQGLTSAATMGAAAASAILEDETDASPRQRDPGAERGPGTEREILDGLVALVAATEPVFMVATGEIVLAPRAEHTA